MTHGSCNKNFINRSKNEEGKQKMHASGKYISVKGGAYLVSNSKTRSLDGYT